jgi:simple sugar transport system ATP-binding protein
MVGREVPPLPSERPEMTAKRPALKLDGLAVPGDGGLSGLRELDLTVHEGEVVGIAAVAGSGQRELAEAIAGTVEWTAGSVTVGETELAQADPRSALRAGVACVPEDPITHWVVPGLSIVENLGLAAMKRPDGDRVRRRSGMDWPALRARAADADERAKLRMAAPHRVVSNLSGGNIQRVLLTDVLTRDAALYVLSYPTRGLDVASCRQVHELILDRRAQGAAVIVISEDLDELRLLADRIVVLHDGRHAGSVAPDADVGTIGELMLGAAA